MTRIGIIGGGQLARMMALAGWHMGVEFSFLASEGESTRCVEGLGTVVVLSPGQSPEQLYAALGEPDVITVERERVDLEILRGFTGLCAVHPNPDAVEACGDRFKEKQLLDSVQLPSAPYRIAESAQQVAEAARTLGLPVVVKNPTEGYDGKQQWHLYDEAQLRAFIDENPPANGWSSPVLSSSGKYPWSRLVPPMATLQSIRPQRTVITTVYCWLRLPLQQRCRQA